MCWVWCSCSAAASLPPQAALSASPACKQLLGKGASWGSVPSCAEAHPEGSVGAEGGLKEAACVMLDSRVVLADAMDAAAVILALMSLAKAAADVGEASKGAAVVEAEASQEATVVEDKACKGAAMVEVEASQGAAVVKAEAA